MSRVRRAITAFFFFFFFFFRERERERERLYACRIPLLFPKSWGGVWGWEGGRAGGCASARRVCE